MGLCRAAPCRGGGPRPAESAPTVWSPDIERGRAGDRHGDGGRQSTRRGWRGGGAHAGRAGGREGLVREGQGSPASLSLRSRRGGKIYEYDSDKTGGGDGAARRRARLGGVPERLIDAVTVHR